MQMGGHRFNPEFVPTSPQEISAQINGINWDVLKGHAALDLYSGTGDIAKQFDGTFPIATNDINSQFKPDFCKDALCPQSYRDWAKFRVAITSPPFSMNDLAIPLMFEFFDVSFVHAPSWFVGDAHDIRHLWLADLARRGQVLVLNTLFTRNPTLGRYCVWLVLSKDKKLLHRLVKHTPYVLNVHNYATS